MLLHGIYSRFCVARNKDNGESMSYKYRHFPTTEIGETVVWVATPGIHGGSLYTHAMHCGHKKTHPFPS